MSDLYKNKELKDCKFNEEEVKECAGKMLSSMMKHDMRKAEGYKLVLMFCLRIFELQHEDKDKLITGIIKTVIFLHDLRSNSYSRIICRKEPSAFKSASSLITSDNTCPSAGISWFL